MKVWNIETGMCEKTLTSHADAISALLGWEKYLVSGSWDKTIKVPFAFPLGDMRKEGKGKRREGKGRGRE